MDLGFLEKIFVAVKDSQGSVAAVAFLVWAVWVTRLYVQGNARNAEERIARETKAREEAEARNKEAIAQSVELKILMRDMIDVLDETKEIRDDLRRRKDRRAAGLPPEPKTNPGGMLPPGVKR